MNESYLRNLADRKDGIEQPAPEIKTAPLVTVNEATLQQLQGTITAGVFTGMLGIVALTGLIYAAVVLL